jgi:hypothetical protein
MNSDCTLNDIYEWWEHCKTSGIDFVGNAISMYPKEGNDRAMELYKHREDVIRYSGELVDSLRKTNNPLYLLSKIPYLFDNIGQFRAYEIYTSLTYSEHIHFKEDDIFLIGPGAIGGLNMITGLNFSSIDSPSILVDLAKIVKQYLIENTDFYWIPIETQGSVNNKEEYKFTVRTLEDSLCEFRKYNNFINNIGKRRKYNQYRVA